MRSCTNELFINISDARDTIEQNSYSEILGMLKNRVWAAESLLLLVFSTADNEAFLLFSNMLQTYTNYY